MNGFGLFYKETFRAYMIDKLIKLSDYLDSSGFISEADLLDGIIKESFLKTPSDDFKFNFKLDEFLDEDSEESPSKPLWVMSESRNLKGEGWEHGCVYFEDKRSMELYAEKKYLSDIMDAVNRGDSLGKFFLDEPTKEELILSYCSEGIGSLEIHDHRGLSDDNKFVWLNKESLISGKEPVMVLSYSPKPLGAFSIPCGGS